MKNCPKCKSLSRVRMPRTGFAKLISGCRAYSCDSCNTYYVWFSLFNKTIKF